MEELLWNILGGFSMFSASRSSELLGTELRHDTSEKKKTLIE